LLGSPFPPQQAGGNAGSIAGIASTFLSTKKVAHMKNQSEQFELKLGRLNLGPNDVLVVSTDEPISDETAERVKKKFEQFPLPFKNKVMVVGDGLKLGKITHE
jgi:hypothetical protein